VTDHASYERFARYQRLVAHRSTLPAPRRPRDSHRALRSLQRSSGCTGRSVSPEPDPIPRASLDDYLGGRADRMGRDLLFDLRPPSGPTRWPLTCALQVAPPFDLRDVLLHVDRLCPDLVWLYPGDLERAHVLARRIVDTGVETIILQELDDDW